MKAKLKVQAERGHGWLAYRWVISWRDEQGRTHVRMSESFARADRAQADGEQWCRDRGLEIDEAQGA